MFSRLIFSISLLFICSVFVQSQPMIWNSESMAFAKKINSEAKKLIIRDADKELVKTITTVVDKPMTPASGDKHDYMSMGRYWWPNPDTKDGLPYIRKDGVSNPELEKLDRVPLAQMTRGIKLLSLAYYLTDDEKYAVKAVENMKRWFIDKKTKMNPNMNFGQTIPGRNEGKGRGEGVLDTYSFVEMLEGVELIKKSRSYDKKTQQALKAWFEEYLNWLHTSEIGKEEFEAKNNHGTAFDVQVARFAAFTGNDELAKKYINEFAERRLFTQIEPNGAQPLELARTTALGYSVFNLSHVIDMCRIAKTYNIDLFNVASSDGRSIKKAFDFLIPYVGKTVADFPYKQIRDWDKVQKELCWELLRADKLMSAPVYKSIYTEYLTPNGKENYYIIY